MSYANIFKKYILLVSYGFVMLHLINLGMGMSLQGAEHLAMKQIYLILDK